MAAGLIAAVPVAAQAAAVSVPCSETALVLAINNANAQPGSDTLNLAAGRTYNLTSSHGDAGNGPVGLSVITSTIALVARRTSSAAPVSPCSGSRRSATPAISPSRGSR